MYSNPNAGSTMESGETYERLALFGVSVYAWDYPGYGLSGGTPDYASVMEAAETALDFVADHSGHPPEDVVLIGRSLGGAVSIGLSRKFGSKALMLLNSLDSLRLLLADCCLLSGWASGLSYAGGHFDAAASLSHFRGCLFQYAATEDEIVYYRRQRDLFYRDSPEKREECSVFVSGEGMLHNSNQWGEGYFLSAFHDYFQKLKV